MRRSAPQFPGKIREVPERSRRFVISIEQPIEERGIQHHGGRKAPFDQTGRFFVAAAFAGANLMPARGRWKEHAHALVELPRNQGQEPPGSGLKPALNVST